MSKVDVFKELLDAFETDDMRAYCSDMIETIPDYIFTMPSSTSYKYHNKTQCQVYGQIYHIIMFGTVMNYILGLKYIRENKFKEPKRRDCMRCTAIFHDAIKCGYDGSKYTAHEHPMLASEWIKNTRVEHDIDERLKKYIAGLCESHSGEWTSSKKSKLVLPEPQSDDAFFVHLADYLNSRSNLDMIYTDELKAALEEFTPELPDINEYVLTFGKYKDKKLVEVAKNDPNYIDWLKENYRNEPVKSLLKQL